MCVARKSGPGREYSVAVDWRDCAWSPRIVVQLPVAAHLDPATRVGRRCPPSVVPQCGTEVDNAAQTSTRTSAAMFLPVLPPAGDKTITRLNPVFFQIHENHPYEK
jgi:hypothetical protein